MNQYLNNSGKNTLPKKYFQRCFLIGLSILAFAWTIYFLPNEGWEAAGFMLLLLGLPASLLVSFNTGSVLSQMIDMSVYILFQWLLIGLWLSKMKARKMKGEPHRKTHLDTMK